MKTRKNCIIFAIALLSLIALIGNAQALPDLVVDRIDPSYVFTNLNNSLFAHVTNQGNATSGDFNVSIEITNAADTTVYTNKVLLSSLNAGASADVYNLEGFLGYWTPTTLENITINVTADCDNDVNEGTGEGNNTIIETRNTTGDCSADDMLPKSCYGYRGQNPLTTAYTGTGKVIYTYGDSVSKAKIANFTIGSGGDKNQVDDQTADIPAGATITNAKVYVYYGWRKTVDSPNPGLDPAPDFEMSINGGSTLTAVANYTDMKGFAGSQYQYGTMVYDVTANVTGNGTYQVVRSNYASGKGYDYAIALMITYDDGSGDTYSIAEGYDRLATLYWSSTYSYWQYYVSPPNATTRATFTDVDPDAIVEAKLFSVAIDTTDGTGTESQRINDCDWYAGAWSKDSGSYLTFNRSDVTSCITPSGTDETVYFREKWQKSGNGFAPVFACLQQTHYPDLVVDRIDPSYVFTNLNNSLFAHVTNQGNATSGDFNVSIEITNAADTTVYTNKVLLSSLNAGASADVYNLEGFLGYWTPTTLENITINVTADCDNDVNEGTGEGNNTIIETRNTTGDCSADDMLPKSCYGYRGQNPLTTAYTGTGKVIYTYGDSVSKAKIANFTIGSGGDKNQVDDQTADIPAGATITNAKVYVYYGWRKTVDSPNPGLDPAPDFEMSINGGSTLTAVANYTDMKGFAGSQYQYGTMVYDVTANVTGNGTYQVVRSNYASGKGYDYAIALMITYDDGSGDTYSIAEGYDRLATLYWSSTYSYWQYYVSPPNATTRATFTDVDPDAIVEAKLFSVAIDTTDGTGTESQRINDCDWYAGAWSKDSGSYLTFNRSDVTSCITPSDTDETVYFREKWQKSGNGFAPVFACLQTSYYIELQNGWNFVSTPKRLAAGYKNASIVFKNVDTDSHYIYKYNTSAGSWKQMGADDKVGPLAGIWIYSNGAAEAPLVYDTYPQHVPPTKMLYAGWNAIGFSDTVSASANEALTSVEAKWSYLIGFDAVNQTYETSIINDATSEAHSETRLMYPTKGYWVYMTADGELAGISA